MNGGDGMIIFYEYLINEALRIVDLKGTVDDIKAGNDLKEINRIITGYHSVDSAEDALGDILS